MLGDAAFNLVGQMSIGPTDQTADFPLHVAVMRFLSCIDDSAQNGAEALTKSSRCPGGAVPLHASGYRDVTFQLETKLNDDGIACGDNDPRELARATQNQVVATSRWFESRQGHQWSTRQRYRILPSLFGDAHFYRRRPRELQKFLERAGDQGVLAVDKNGGNARLGFWHLMNTDGVITPDRTDETLG
jgi:hypothetical protein